MLCHRQQRKKESFGVSNYLVKKSGGKHDSRQLCCGHSCKKVFVILAIAVPVY